MIASITLSNRMRRSSRPTRHSAASFGTRSTRSLGAVAAGSSAANMPRAAPVKDCVVDRCRRGPAVPTVATERPRLSNPRAVSIAPSLPSFLTITGMIRGMSMCVVIAGESGRSAAGAAAANGAKSASAPAGSPSLTSNSRTRSSATMGSNACSPSPARIR